MVDVTGFAAWIQENITMSDPDDPEVDTSDDDVIWVPQNQELRNALVRNGTIPEEPNLEGNSIGHGIEIAFPPIRLSNDIEIVFETPRPNFVYLRCVDEVSPYDQEKGNPVAPMTHDQVHAMARDIVGKVLDGMGVEQNGNMVDENEVEKENPREKTEIVYEAAGPDEVEVIEIDEEYEAEKDENDAEEFEEGEVSSVSSSREGEVINVEDDSDDAGFEAVNPVGPRPEREFKEFNGDDAEEKADLADEGWEVQKNLKTDLQRLKYAQKAFGNCIQTDPTRCLTFHGYARLSKEQRGADHYPVESKTEQVLVKKWMHSKIENGRIFNENVPGLSSSNFGSPEVGSRKRKANDGHEDGPQRKRQRIKFDVIERKMWQMLNQVKRPLFAGGYGDNRRSFERYMGHYKNGLRETREFLNFYDDVNNNTLVDSEFGHMEAYELLYKQFVTMYGPNTSEMCKDCSHWEQTVIHHPY